MIPDQNQCVLLGEKFLTVSLKFLLVVLPDAVMQLSRCLQFGLEMKVQIADLQEESKITRAAVNYNGQRLDDLYSVLKENHVIA